VAAYDEAGLIGEGRHERFAVNEEKFMGKASARLQS
jgi:predicted thioesterase